MVIIRLARGGTKKRPFFHVVVTNSKNSRDGRFIERLGFYNPIAVGGEVKLQFNKERLDYWVNNGAQISERAAYLIDNFAKIAASKAKGEDKTEESKAEKKSKEHSVDKLVESE
jgi:small subunit ribosomal protein S16